MPDTDKEAWLVEEGIGEHRAIRLDAGTIAAARIQWPGRLTAGQVEDAILVSRHAGSPRGTVRFASGEEALADGLPLDASEGAALRMAVTRAAVAETGRYKLALARPTDEPSCPAPTLAERLRAQGEAVHVVRRFPSGDWPDLFAEAWDGHVEFRGGSLTVSPTPAMTLIDIDGILPLRQLALAAVPPLAATIARFGLGGSIGIDFPTLADKHDRKSVDEALEQALGRWPHQHTAMNGFGFVQLVSRLEAPSILHRIRLDRAGAAACLLLRQAEGIEGAGTLLLTAHPAVRAAVLPEWQADLARRTGRAVQWESDPSLALPAGFAQAVAP